MHMGSACIFLLQPEVQFLYDAPERKKKQNRKHCSFFSSPSIKIKYQGNRLENSISDIGWPPFQLQ